uniref:Uncharacterized protein n=1 Tax=Anaerolinea thermolimosa TaxID=229919 RepID=A0A7C4PI69_9CHLR
MFTPGVGLYGIYQQRGPSFIPDYKNLLASTGEDTAANLAARFGIAIKGKSFLATILGMIGDEGYATL